MVAFVEPPMALWTMMAFSNASWVRMSLTKISFSINSIICRPALLAQAKMSRMVAGIRAAPGSVRPNASAMHCIVLAVPRKVQAPQDGQPVSLYSRISRALTAFFRFCRREMSPATRDVVILGPGRILPPGTKMVGRSSRAAAFS